MYTKKRKRRKTNKFYLQELGLSPPIRAVSSRVRKILNDQAGLTPQQASNRTETRSTRAELNQTGLENNELLLLVLLLMMLHLREDAMAMEASKDFPACPSYGLQRQEGKSTAKTRSDNYLRWDLLVGNFGVVEPLRISSFCSNKSP